jgi:hypothetical protein
MKTTTVSSIAVDDPIVSARILSIGHTTRQLTLEDWRDRALSAELEVRDLLKEQQRLQYTLEEVTNELARTGARNKQDNHGLQG